MSGDTTTTSIYRDSAYRLNDGWNDGHAMRLAGSWRVRNKKGGIQVQTSPDQEKVC